MTIRGRHDGKRTEGTTGLTVRIATVNIRDILGGIEAAG